MRIIDDEYALPAPNADTSIPRFEYVRSLCDPCILIDTRTGENFTRRDGAKWEWPGYRIHYKRETDRVTREPATAAEDFARYKPDGDVERLMPKSTRAA